jgi:hypothetical protein
MAGKVPGTFGGDSQQQSPFAAGSSAGPHTVIAMSDEESPSDKADELVRRIIRLAAAVDRLPFEYVDPLVQPFECDDGR